MSPERQALVALVSAIDNRWDGETAKRRDNALGPAIEKALSRARMVLGNDLPETPYQKSCRELAKAKAIIKYS